jgi:hypothetical protein
MAERLLPEQLQVPLRVSNLWLPPKGKHDRSSPPPVIRTKEVDQSDHIHPTPLLIRLNFQG